MRLTLFTREIYPFTHVIQSGDHVETALFPDLSLTSKFSRKAPRVG